MNAEEKSLADRLTDLFRWKKEEGNANDRDEKGRTALMLACQVHASECVRYVQLYKTKQMVFIELSRNLISTQSVSNFLNWIPSLMIIK